MKVLHINSYYNGAPLYTNLYNEQISQGIDLNVYVPLAKGAKIYNQFGDYTAFSYDYTQADRLLFHKKARCIYNGLIKQYDINKYDIVHAHSLFTNGYIAYELKKKYGIPYIVAVRNTDVNVFFKKMPHLRSIGISIIDNADKVVFISQSYKEIVRLRYINRHSYEAFDRKVIVIPNGIDNYWYANLNNDKKIAGNVIKIICVGDIDKNKNQITICKACKELENEGYNVQFSIVGRIVDNKIYKQLLLSGANYLGTAHKDDLLKYYRENDIFVMPSRFETFGLVYAEAMSQGLPLIYSKGQGFDGQFEEGIVGYHVNYFDYKGIVCSIKKILNNYSFISHNCIALCKRYRWSEIAKKYLNIYEQIC